MAEYTLKNIPADIYQPALHAKWVTEALESGSAKPFKMKDMDAAFAAGLKRATARKADK
jgi:hypothetical protein